MTRVAVIGLGIGRVHLEEYAKNVHAELVAVMDVDPARAEEMGQKHGVPGFTNLDALLEGVPIDAASICSPPKHHAPQVERLARAGVHCLVEKPMAPSIRDGQRMIRAAADANVVLMIAQKKRFTSPYAFLKERFASDFGQPLWANVKYALGSVSKDWFWDEEDGGGPILENAIHVFDIIRYLMGEVKALYAHGGNLFRPDVAPQLDVAAVSMELANGGCVSLGCGYASEWGFADERISIATPRIVCEVSGPFDRPNLLRYVDRANPSNVSEMHFEEPAGFAEEIAEFLDAIHEHREPAVTGQDAIRSIAMALAVKRSIREKRLVRIDEMGAA